MTDIGSCKTCRYFDLKDGDSETNNWCRCNNRPAINEGLCGCYKPMIRPCPICGGEVELRDKSDGADETFFIHCTKCHMWFEKFDWRGYGHAHIIEEWNRRGERMVNGYKEHIVEVLWKSERPMGFDELSEDVCSFEIGRFNGKLCELISDGYVRKANGRYALTRRCIESIRDYGGCNYVL